MSDRDLIEYLTARERQQRAVVDRAILRDVIEFHSGLAEHYARLLVEARAMTAGS